MSKPYLLQGVLLLLFRPGISLLRRSSQFPRRLWASLESNFSQENLFYHFSTLQFARITASRAFTNHTRNSESYI